MIPNFVWFTFGMVAGQLLRLVYITFFKKIWVTCGWCKGLGWRNVSKTTDHGQRMFSTETITIRCEHCDNKGSVKIFPHVEIWEQLRGRINL